jgi:hypothetical protein
MRYPQTFIDDLKRQADIVRVIQDYVQLKKKGANWMACCPFHKEKTPSFSVSPAKEIFYCFGCHKGGSVFTFVMEIERVPFPEAIKIVADKVGMPLPTMVDDGRFEARRQESDHVIQLNAWAMEWWQQQLESSNEGRLARDYLKDRGITEETVKTFRLGYAPDSWDALSIYLRNKGATQEHIDRSGLVAKKEDSNRSYDRFRCRLMIPVLDAQARRLPVDVDAAVRNLAASLAPGGAILLIEPDFLPVSVAEPPEVRAFWDGWLAWAVAQGIDYHLGRRLAPRLAALGLEPALAKVGVTTREAVFFNRFGQLIYKEPRGKFGGYVDAR